ncbi:hypothetical protein E4T47_00812 [Aureobasidium subglaciale]|nr:hypothetical protein E4T47_00812 [Aureobasidium subglaciale]
MRILPPNWEGLHPAYPSKPAPFNESALTKAPFWAGGCGALAAGLALLTKRPPAQGLKIAAWTTIIFGTASVGVERYAGRLIARPYLESKGVEIPKSKIIDRPFEIDADNYILAGGLIGLGFAASVRKPWNIVGWQRWLGAFSCGSFAGASFNQIYHYNTSASLAETIARQQTLRNMWMEDVKRFIENKAIKDSGRNPEDLKQPGMTTMADMLKNVGDAQNAMVKEMHAAAALAAQTAQEEDVDEQDPQPHFSEMREGERVFFPEPNYKWQPGSDAVQQIESHIQQLKERRSRLAEEASMLFYELASKQNDLYLTDKEDFEREQRRVDAELMGHLHTQTYIEISRLDWCIADSQKTRLQLKALENGQQWLPQKPESQLKPHHARRLLDDFDHENEIARAEMDMLAQQAVDALRDPGLGAIDMTTGKVVEDPHSQIKKDLEELKRVQKESTMIREAITKLRTEMGIEKKDD